MDGIAIVALGAVVSLLGLVLAFAAVRLTRNQERGRGASVLFALFVPALYVGYLLAAASFRNDYRRTHSKAYEAQGFNNLALGHGYMLWFFDEIPWMSSIGRGQLGNPILTNIQRLSAQGTTVIGQTGRTEILDGPTDSYFALNLSSGSLLKFKTESELRAAVRDFGPMRRPEELYNSEADKEHGSLFWPIVCVAPAFLAAGIWQVVRRSRVRPAELTIR